MPTTLQRLVYESAATGSTGSVLNLATILGESQRNNDRRGLTGVLAAHEGRYIQVIEGPAEALDRLMAEPDPSGALIIRLLRQAVDADQSQVA